MFEAGFAYILSKSLIMNTRTTANVVNFIATSLLQFQAVFIQKKFLHAHRYIALAVLISFTGLNYTHILHLIILPQTAYILTVLQQILQEKTRGSVIQLIFLPQTEVL